jgi:septum formation protein
MTGLATFVLASSSPRRRRILERLGLPIRVIAPDVEERREPGEDVAGYVLRAALEKATAVARTLAVERNESPWVIGADTVVVVDGSQLGKPKDRAEAREMIGLLSGREHSVLTGWAVLNLDRRAERTGVETTRVWFKALRPAEADAYVATGEGLDKAGAYGIQGIGCFLVERIDGDYENVVGLPACAIVEALQTVGALEVFPLVGCPARGWQP